MTKEEKIQNSIILLKTTLGSMRGDEADGVVRVVIEILKEKEIVVGI